MDADKKSAYCISHMPADQAQIATCPAVCAVAAAVAATVGVKFDNFEGQPNVNATLVMHIHMPADRLIHINTHTYMYIQIEAIKVSLASSVTSPAPITDVDFFSRFCFWCCFQFPRNRKTIASAIYAIRSSICVCGGDCMNSHS